MHALRVMFFAFCLGALAIAFYKIKDSDLKKSPDANPISMDIFKTLEDLPWFNVSRPLTNDDLKGKIVLIDFWTYCCINCMHVLPDLEKLEKEFSKELVVIGAHSAKFNGEKDSANIREAILRYGIHHPVVNDAGFKLWQAFGIRAWPSFVLLDARGRYRGSTSGEGQYQTLKEAIQNLVEEAKAQKVLSEHDLPYRPESAPTSFLSYPGKIAKDPDGHFWISDTNHHRILKFLPTGVVEAVIGTGLPGKADGNFQEASFFQPQGIVAHDRHLYVADTSNHLIRAIDLQTQRVSTIAGTGERAYDRSPSGKALRTPMASPWDVEMWNPSGNHEILAIALAGNHQIWAYDFKTQSVSLLAGSGQENLDDGAAKEASLAQPSGLFAVGSRLYFVDSETSSLRYLENNQVHTLVGSGLFDFGLVDGPKEVARLQHSLGLFANSEFVLIADTYNNAIRKFDLRTRKITTLIHKDLNEPNDVWLDNETIWIVDTNNNAIKTFSLKANRLDTIPVKSSEAAKPTLSTEHELLSELPYLPNLVTLEKRTGGLTHQDSLKIHFHIELPPRHKLNQAAPSEWVLYSQEGKNYRVAQTQPLTSTDFEISVSPWRAREAIVDLTYYHCPKTTDDIGQCEIKSFRLPIHPVAADLAVSVP